VRPLPEGLPNYVDVPGQINVSEILRLWTYGKPLGLIEWGKMRYNLLARRNTGSPARTPRSFEN